MSKILIIFFALSSFNLCSGGLSVKTCSPQMVDIVKDVVNTIFENSTSICYIFERNSVRSDQIFRYMDKPILTIEYEKINQTWTKKLFCEGYILNIKSFQRFKTFLTKRASVLRAIKPHRRLIIFYKGKAVVHFPELLELYALDVIEIELPYVCNFEFRNGRIETETFRVTSMEKRTVLFEWYLNETRFFIDRSKLAETKWNPHEMFRRTNGSFRFSVFECDPFMYIDKANNRLTGPEINLAKEMTKGFPVEYMFVPKTEHNPWMYVLDLVEKGKSDMAGCSQFIINLSKAKIDFTVNQNQICFTFLVPKARFLPATTFLIQPFNADIWILLIFAICLFIAVLYIFIYGARWGWSEKNDMQPDSRYCMNVLRIYSAGSVFFKPGASIPLHGKVLLISLIFHSLLISTYYSAGLSSNLALPRLTKEINTLQDLVDFHITFQGDNSLLSDFEFVNSTLFRQLTSLYRKGDRLETVLDGTTAVSVKTLENAYVTDIEGLDEVRIQNYQALKECVGKYYMGFILQRNSPFTRRFRTVAVRTVESGILSKWLHEKLYSEKKMQDPFFTSYVQNIRFATIDLEKLLGGFILMAVGYSIASVVFIAEIITHKYTVFEFTN